MAGPRCAGSSSRCAPDEAAEALVVAARSCRTIGGVLRLVHVRTCDRPARRVGRFYTETADIGAVLDKAPPAVWACGGPQSIPECAVGPGVPSQPSNPITPLAPATPNNAGTTPVNLGAVACGGNITRDGDDNRAGTHAWYTVTFNQSLLTLCTLAIDLTCSADLFAVHSGTFDGPLVTTNGPVSSFTTTTGDTYFIDVSGGVDGVPFSLQITTH